MKDTPTQTSNRPWGKFEIFITGKNYQVKRLTVNPKQKISLQSHNHRSEYWVVVTGTAKVTLGSKEKILQKNESVFISPKRKHRLENPGKNTLEIIEIQNGDYLGEDDIIRYEDIYNRK